MAYRVIIRRPGSRVQWRAIVDDILGYPRAKLGSDGHLVELHTGTVIDLSGTKQLPSGEVEEFQLTFIFRNDSESASDSVFDVARLVGKKHGVQFWHPDFGIDYATASEREIIEAFDGEAPEEGGG